MMQYVKLLGILDDGSDLAPELWEVPRRVFSIPRGGRATIDVTIVTRANVPVAKTGTISFAADKSLLGGVGECQGVGIPALTKSGSNVPGELASVFRVVLEPEDTDTLEVGRYLYDVWYQDGAGPAMQVIPAASMHLAQAIGVAFA